MRPFVTLAYSQSIDGSIALPGRPLALSGPESMKMTHELRAAHDGILVGIGTILIDDPRLTVRLASGRNPQPIVLDSNLRFPLAAALLKHPSHSLWVAVTDPDPERQPEIEACGAQIIRLPPAPNGGVDLHALLERLGELGVQSLMVEGGARVIQSFLEARLVDRLVFTIIPRLVGGVKAIDSLSRIIPLHNPVVRQLGSDIVVEADLRG